MELIDFRRWNHHGLILRVNQRNAGFILSSRQPGKNATVLRRHDDTHVFFANHAAGVNEADQEKVPVPPICRCQIGAKFSPFTKELMTCGTVLFKDSLSGFDIAFGGSHIIVKSANFGQLLFARRRFQTPPMFGNQGVELRVFK